MSDHRTDEGKVDALIDFLGDAIFEASDEETREDLRKRGLDPDREAARLKRLMLDTVRSFQQRALTAAREGYNLRLKQRETVGFAIPGSPAERRELFTRLVHQPEVTPLLTAHFRDLTHLTDEDIQSLLEDLAALGILADPRRGESNEE